MKNKIRKKVLTMKRYCLFFLLFTLVFNHIMAQENDKQSLYFIYITSDYSGNQNNLINLLEKDYKDAIDNEFIYYFYLPNSNLIKDVNGYNILEPTIVKIDPFNQNEKEFESLIAKVGGDNVFNGAGMRDIQYLINMFYKQDFVNDAGKLLYNVNWKIYATPDFWNQQKEQFIAAFWWVFDFHSFGAASIPQVFLDLKSSDLDYDEKEPFGIRNLGGINDWVPISDYSIILE